MITVGQLRRELATYSDDTPVIVGCVEKRFPPSKEYRALVAVEHDVSISPGLVAELLHGDECRDDDGDLIDCPHTTCPYGRAIPVVYLQPRGART